MKQLKHPNIVDLKHCFHSQGDNPDELYQNLVLEFLPDTVYGVARRAGKQKQRDAQQLQQQQRRWQEQQQRWQARAGAPAAGGAVGGKKTGFF